MQNSEQSNSDVVPQSSNTDIVNETTAPTDSDVKVDETTVNEEELQKV